MAVLPALTELERMNVAGAEKGREKIKRFFDEQRLKIIGKEYLKENPQSAEELKQFAEKRGLSFAEMTELAQLMKGFDVWGEQRNITAQKQGLREKLGAGEKITEEELMGLALSDPQAAGIAGQIGGVGRWAPKITPKKPIDKYFTDPNEPNGKVFHLRVDPENLLTTQREMHDLGLISIEGAKERRARAGEERERAAAKMAEERIGISRRTEKRAGEKTEFNQLVENIRLRLSKYGKPGMLGFLSNTGGLTASGESAYSTLAEAAKTNLDAREDLRYINKWFDDLAKISTPEGLPEEESITEKQPWEKYRPQ
jgi:hypothetical protein